MYSGRSATLGFLPAVPAVISAVTAKVGPAVLDKALDWMPGGGGGSYPKPLPPRMPFSDREIAEMLALLPDVRDAIVEQMRHVWKYIPQRLGREANDGDLRPPYATLGRLAHWFGDGWEMSDLNQREEAIRVLIFAGMDELALRQAEAIQHSAQQARPATSQLAPAAPAAMPGGWLLPALLSGAVAVAVLRR